MQKAKSYLLSQPRVPRPRGREGGREGGSPSQSRPLRSVSGKRKKCMHEGGRDEGGRDEGGREGRRKKKGLLNLGPVQCLLKVF